jgi:protein involved in polysaccharide export with SLBB domain
MITGAVREQGSKSLAKPATIRMALDAAGGFATTTPQMKPADVITVRRPLGDRKVDVSRFSTSDVPPTWEEFELHDGDLVVFQGHIEPEKT